MSVIDSNPVVFRRVQLVSPEFRRKVLPSGRRSPGAGRDAHGLGVSEVLGLKVEGDVYQADHDRKLH